MRNKLLGASLSFLFGLVAAIPWVILNYFGWIASIAAYLIGLASYKGYVKGNGSFDSFGKICIILIILFTVPGAILVSIFISALQYGFNFTESLAATFFVFFEYFVDYLPSILIGYFMAGLGTYEFFLPNRKQKAKTLEIN